MDFEPAESPLLRKSTTLMQKTKREAALKLYKAGCAFEVVQACLGEDIDLAQLLNPAPQNFSLEAESPMFVRGLSVQSEGLPPQQKDLDFDHLWSQVEEDDFEGENSIFLDIITMGYIRDPVVVSTGHVYEKSYLCNENNQVKSNMNKCFKTGLPIERSAYPYVMLKEKITQRQTEKLSQLIFIAKNFRNDETKFNQAIERAEEILHEETEDRYKVQSLKIAKMIMRSKFSKTQEQKAESLTRAIKVLRGEQKKNFIRQYTEFMLKEVDEVLKTDFDSALQKLEHFENMNKMENAEIKFDTAILAQKRFELMKNFPDKFDKETYEEEMRLHQKNILEKILYEQGAEAAEKYLEDNGLDKSKFERQIMLYKFLKMKHPNFDPNQPKPAEEAKAESSDGGYGEEDDY